MRGLWGSSRAQKNAKKNQALPVGYRRVFLLCSIAPTGVFKHYHVVEEQCFLREETSDRH